MTVAYVPYALDISASLTLDEVCYMLNAPQSGYVCDMCSAPAVVDGTDLCEDCYVEDCDQEFQTWWILSRCSDCVWFDGPRWSDEFRDTLAGICRDCAYDG